LDLKNGNLNAVDDPKIILYFKVRTGKSDWIIGRE